MALLERLTSASCSTAPLDDAVQRQATAEFKLDTRHKTDMNSLLSQVPDV